MARIVRAKTKRKDKERTGTKEPMEERGNHLYRTGSAGKGVKMGKGEQAKCWTGQLKDSRNKKFQTFQKRGGEKKKKVKGMCICEIQECLIQRSGSSRKGEEGRGRKTSGALLGKGIQEKRIH